MKRRGFLKVLLGAAMAPVIAPLAIAAPVKLHSQNSISGAHVGRGMSSSIFHIDEAGFYPTTQNAGIKKLQQNSVYGRFAPKPIRFTFSDSISITRGGVAVQ